MISRLSACSQFVLDSSSKLGYIVCQFFSPRGALARRRRLREQNTVLQGLATLVTRGPGCPPGLPAAFRSGFLRGAPPELTIGRFASPARLKEPCARALPALHHLTASSRTASRATPRSTLQAGAKRLRPEGARSLTASLPRPEPQAHASSPLIGDGQATIPTLDLSGPLLTEGGACPPLPWQLPESRA